MCEIQDYSIEHKDIYKNKYSLCSDMDLYITDSLQDLLDMDIKNEMATDLGTRSDFSDSLGLSFTDLPPLLDMETENAPWINSTSSGFGHNLDIDVSEANAVMVNPNCVMPSMFADTPVKSIVKEGSNLLLTSANTHLNNSSTFSSPKEEKSHLTFSPNKIKMSEVREPEEPKQVLEEVTQMVVLRKNGKNVVKDLLKDLDNNKKNTITSQMVATNPAIRIKSLSDLQRLSSKNTVVNNNQKVTQQIGSKTILPSNIHILEAPQSRTILVDASHSKNGVNKNAVSEYPKPAYSYSCLIAMALKNSRTGSLPVSEIYNFMCHHFPYFKTAPNGWKNSVRHNLSLNKCFEKIEKPSTNGNQRKGCLWAMNPAKVGKMDEEVLKWSRKDPQAIKKAMVQPDDLEALERGEMKYSVAGGDVEAEDDVDIDLDTEVDTELEIDPEVKEEEEETIVEQESDQELEIELDEGEEAEEVVSGTGMVGGIYRLLPARPSNCSAHDDLSDIEVYDHAYEEFNIDIAKPLKFDISLSEKYTIQPVKRAKTNYIYHTVPTTQTHTSRRKTPLVNRVALM